MSCKNFGGNELAIMACVLGAIYLAANNKPGWGWLLFIAFCLA